MAKLVPTPGPWHIKDDYDGRTIVVANVDGETFADGTSSYSYDFVCDTYGDGDDDSRSITIAIANARLIAALPDLLAALRSIIEADDAFRATMSPQVEKDPVTRACDAARDAIAKAEGR